MKRFAFLTIGLAVLLFQNCGKGFEDSLNGSLLISGRVDANGVQSTPTSTVISSASPGATPTPRAANKVIPSQAILDIQNFPSQKASEGCPAGLFRQKNDDELNGQTTQLCLKTFSNEINPMVVSDIVLYVNGIGCPTGSQALELQRFNSESINRVCIKYSAASQASQFVTGIRIGYLWVAGGQSSDMRCRSWERKIALRGDFAFAGATYSEISACYFSFDGNGKPWKAITSLYTAIESQGCVAGDRTVRRFRSGNTARGSAVLCASYGQTVAGTSFVTDVATPGEGQTCPVGFTRTGEMFNSHVPNRRYPICSRSAVFSVGSQPLSLIYLPAYTTPRANTVVSGVCKAIDSRAGDLPIYGAGAGADFLIGLANFCGSR